MEIVVIKNFNSEPRAQIAASILRDNGIECAVNGENTAYSWGVSKVTLSVCKEDEERALELLADY